MPYLALNGRLMPEEQARLSPLDRGFLYGDGLFETIKARNGRVEFLERHLRRMREGARSLGIPFPEGLPIPSLIEEVLERNRLLDEASVKICLSRGVHEGPLLLYPPSEPTLLILARPYTGPSPEDWERGISVTLERSFHQNESSPLCRLKTLNFLPYLLARTRAREEGFDDAVLLNTRGEVCECTTSNLFFFRDGGLETPHPACGLLPGILREVVMECLASAGSPVRETRPGADVLEDCEEAFVTNSMLEILPVARIEGRELRARERTREVRERFREHRDALHARGRNGEPRGP